MPPFRGVVSKRGAARAGAILALLYLCVGYAYSASQYRPPRSAVGRHSGRERVTTWVSPPATTAAGGWEEKIKFYRADGSSRRGGVRMAATLSQDRAAAAPTVAGSGVEGGDRVRLNVMEFNRRGEEGIPVVILHGLLGQGRNFRSWGMALHERLARPRRVLIPDLRNHGASGHADDMTYRHMAEDVLALLDREGIERAVLVGHSMGGKVAAAAGLRDPARVAGLVVMDIAPVSYTLTDGTNWADTSKVIEMLGHVPVDDVQEKADADRVLTELGLEDPGLRSFVLMNLVRKSGGEEGGPRFAWQINVRGIQRSLNHIAGFDIPESQGGACYPHKTLFLNGGKSKYLRAAHLPEIARLFPTFSMATIRDAGHWVHADAPEDTLAIVQRYLDQEMAL